MKHLYWIAGFIEGEGTFSGPNSGTVITAMQVQREPLERMQEYCGGSLQFYPEKRGNNRNDRYMWSLGGARGRGLMMTLYPLLSPKRQTQVRTVLERWRREGVKKGRIACPHGHAYVEENTIIRTDGRRACRMCLETHRAADCPVTIEVTPLLYPVLMEAKRQWEEKFCPHGHERTLENTYVVPKDGKKLCRVCRQEQKATYDKETRIPHPHQAVTHCSRGHEYTPETTYIIPSTGQRTCKLCNVIRSQEFRLAHPGYNGHKGKGGRKTLDVLQE